MLDVVLDLFVAEMKTVDVGSPKSELLAATCTSLAAVNKELLSASVVKKMFKVRRVSLGVWSCVGVCGH